MMELYKINETMQHTYYQMPQELFDNEKYKYLSIEAKVIYSFLLNRMNLSRINHWTNNCGEIYLIYTRKEIQSKLNLSDKPVTRAFKELRDTELIKEEKQGFGKPNLIYIGKIEQEELQINDIDTENILDLMFYSNNLKIGQAVLPQEIVRSRMQLLNASIIFYAFDKLNYLKQDSQIHNRTNFMISCLYNAITEYYSDSDLQYKIDYGSG